MDIDPNTPVERRALFLPVLVLLVCFVSFQLFCVLFSQVQPSRTKAAGNLVVVEGGPLHGHYFRIVSEGT